MTFKKALALVAAVCLLAAVAVPAYADGRTVHIKTAEDLRELSRKCRLDTYSEKLTVVLDNDIDLSGEPFEPIATFSGSFEGGGHSITGVTLLTDGAHQGFFRYVQESGAVRELNVQGTVNPQYIRTEIGGLVGTNYGLIQGCSFSGEVHGLEQVGGLVGCNRGTVRESSFSGAVSGKRYTGGIAGYNEGLIDLCGNSGEVNTVIETAPVDIDDISISDIAAIPVVTAEDSDSVSDTGGIAGFSDGIISDSRNSGIIGYPHYGYNVGGIAGRQSGYVTGCENNGEVRGRKDVGGIVGQMEPYLAVSQTDNLIDELKLLSSAITVAMSNLDSNSAATGAVMSDMQQDANNAIDSAREMDKNSETPVLPDNQSGGTAGDSGGIDWSNVGDKAGEVGGQVSDIGAQLGEGTVSDIISGDVTQEDWSTIGEVGGGVAEDLGGKIGDKIDERQAEKAAAEEAEQQRQTNYNAAQSALSGSLGNMSGNIGRLSNQLSGTASALARDIQAVNQHFYRAMDILGSILGGENVRYEDISDEDTQELTDGKVSQCVNNGSVDGDISVGGIAGDMGIEIEYDLEGIITDKLQLDMDAKIFEARCVARSCVNNGSVTGKKNYIGGITGYTELGSIISCEGYGTVGSDTAGFVGGIVGLSDTVVRDSFAMCGISGTEYVGGIAGKGVKISGCGTRISVSASTAAVGAIAGWADVREREQVAENDSRYGSDELYFVYGNSFIGDTLGGIDGVSYTGRAQPLSEKEFFENPAVPEHFRKIKITFTAEGAVVAELEGVIGRGINEKDIPAVPAKAEFTGYWPELDPDELRSDTVLEAVYRPNLSGIASEQTRSEDGMPVVLLDGSFSDCSELKLREYTELTLSIPEALVLEQWEYSLLNNPGGSDSYSVRYLPPETENGRRILEIYSLQGDSWVKQTTTEQGSYTVFDGSGEGGVFAVLEFRPDYTTAIIAGGAAAAAVIAALLVVLLRKNRKSDNVHSEYDGATVPTENTDAETPVEDSIETPEGKNTGDGN